MITTISFFSKKVIVSRIFIIIIILVLIFSLAYNFYELVLSPLQYHTKFIYDSHDVGAEEHDENQKLRIETLTDYLDILNIPFKTKTESSAHLYHDMTKSTDDEVKGVYVTSQITEILVRRKDFDRADDAALASYEINYIEQND